MKPDVAVIVATALLQSRSSVVTKSHQKRLEKIVAYNTGVPANLKVGWMTERYLYRLLEQAIERTPKTQ